MGLFNKSSAKIIENVAQSNQVEFKPGVPIIGYSAQTMKPDGTLGSVEDYYLQNIVENRLPLEKDLIVQKFSKSVKEVDIPNDKNYYTVTDERITVNYTNMIFETILYSNIYSRDKYAFADKSQGLQAFFVCAKCRSLPIVEINKYTVENGKLIFFCKNHSLPNLVPISEFYEQFPELYHIKFITSKKNFTPTVITAEGHTNHTFVEVKAPPSIETGKINDLTNLFNFTTPNMTKSSLDEINDKSVSIQKTPSEGSYSREEELDNVIAELNNHKTSEISSVFNT